LKSEGFASNVYDPEGRSTLREFCRENSLAYGETDVPIPLETITAYGLWFQRREVPDLEDRTVEVIARASDHFRLQLADGETVIARRVVVAVGGGYFRHVPRHLQDLPAEFLSHSTDHQNLSQFRGRDVTVIGGGASALDLAALLYESEVDVRLVARRPLVFLAKPRQRTIWNAVRHPLTGIGRGWKNRFFTDAAMVFRHLPQKTRLRIVQTHLGPAGVWSMKDRIVGRVPLLLGCKLTRAETHCGRVRLHLVDSEGGQKEVSTDHVIAATGYRIDLWRLTFLNEEIRSSLRALEGAPVLSRNFQSSIPGLYFVGLASAFDFGPVMRFMFGAGYTARRLSQHLGRKLPSAECGFELAEQCAEPKLDKSAAC
jgi:hypothetical protein